MFSSKRSLCSFDEEYPIKIVLVNGLKRKPENCDQNKLRKLICKKGFQIKKENDCVTELLNKVGSNINVFKIEELHGILNIPLAKADPEKPDRSQEFISPLMKSNKPNNRFSVPVDAVTITPDNKTLSKQKILSVIKEIGDIMKKNGITGDNIDELVDFFEIRRNDL